MRLAGTDLDRKAAEHQMFKLNKFSQGSRSETQYIGIVMKFAYSSFNSIKSSLVEANNRDSRCSKMS